MGVTAAGKPNWANRTLWTGDNLDIMRGMNSESVDLIYLDPPFNSNKTYTAPMDSAAAGASFKDTWSSSDLDPAWYDEVSDSEPALCAVIDAAGQAPRQLHGFVPGHDGRQATRDEEVAARYG